MTRSIQLRGIERAVGGEHQTKERLSLESLNSRTREYIRAGQLGQLFFNQADAVNRRVDDVRQGMCGRQTIFLFSSPCELKPHKKTPHRCGVLV